MNNDVTTRIIDPLTFSHGDQNQWGGWVTLMWLLLSALSSDIWCFDVAKWYFEGIILLEQVSF